MYCIDANRHKYIKAITPHSPHSQNRVLGNSDDVELRKIEQETSLSLSNMFFENEKRQVGYAW